MEMEGDMEGDMVTYPMFFLLLSTCLKVMGGVVPQLFFDTFLTLRGVWGFYLNCVLQLKTIKVL